MGERDSKSKGKSGKSGSDNIQEAKVNPVHVRIDFGEAISYGKAILSSKASLISSVQHLKNYEKLREKELDKKADVRELLHNVHVIIGMIERDMPKLKEEQKKRIHVTKQKIAEEIKEETKEQEIIPIQKEEPKVSAMEQELLEINQRLNALSRLA